MTVDELRELNPEILPKGVCGSLCFVESVLGSDLIELPNRRREPHAVPRHGTFRDTEARDERTRARSRGMDAYIAQGFSVPLSCVIDCISFWQTVRVVHTVTERSLDEIASRYGVSVMDIRQWNRDIFPAGEAVVLWPGRQLVVYTQIPRS